MTSLIKRIMKQMKNDKRSLALMMMAPILILTLLWLLLGDTDFTPTIAYDTLPNKLQSAFQESGAKLLAVDGQDPTELLKSKKADAIVSVDLTGIHIKLLDSSDSMTAGAVTKVIKDALQKLSPSTSMEMTYVYGKADASMFDSMGYLLLGILSFFIVFMIAGISFIRERTTQTMERLMLTPIRRWQVVMGYTLGFGFFSTIQSILIVLFTRYVLGME
ncbi:MAG: ABC transporter permease, partial [Clostridia bacterium]|nr:ABC transporter permease [Clostridia bacterium]